MRLRILSFFCLFVFLFPAPCSGETVGGTDQIRIGEWNWDPGVVNTFSGSVDVSSLAGQEITLRISADFNTSEDTGDSSGPVFTVINGKRVTVLRQSDTATITPEGNDPAVTFEGSLKMPEKGHLQRIGLTVVLTDGNGKEIRRITETADRNDGSGDTASGVFYIPFNINVLLTAFSCAALIVWGAVCWKYLAKRKKKQE